MLDTAFKQKIKPLGIEKMKVFEFFNLLMREKDLEILESVQNGTVIKYIFVYNFN